MKILKIRTRDQFFAMMYIKYIIPTFRRYKVKDYFIISPKTVSELIRLYLNKEISKRDIRDFFDATVKKLSKI